MKNKNIGGYVLSTELDPQKRPQCKNVQKMQKIIKHRKNFLARFAHSEFCKIHIFGAANRQAPVQYAKYVFFLSSSSGSNIFVPQQIL